VSCLKTRRYADGNILDHYPQGVIIIIVVIVIVATVPVAERNRLYVDCWLLMYGLQLVNIFNIFN